MLVDVHGHFGHATPGSPPPARLTMYAGVCGVDYVLISNRDAATGPQPAANVDETDANLLCLEVCRRHARLAPLYFVRPGQPDSNPYAMAGALKTEPFLGAVFAPGAVGFDAGDKLIEPYLSALAAIGRPALFCTSGDASSSSAKIYEQARRFPTLPVLLCACGVSGAGPAAKAALPRELLETARHAMQRADARLFIDTSHASAADILAAIEALGPERVMFGTDAVSYGDSHIPRNIALLDELRRILPAEHFQLLTGGNASRLFHLRPPVRR